MKLKSEGSELGVIYILLHLGYYKVSLMQSFDRNCCIACLEIKETASFYIWGSLSLLSTLGLVKKQQNAIFVVVCMYVSLSYILSLEASML